MPDLSNLEPGLAGTASLQVSDEHTALHMKSGRARTLSSPIMIALMEQAAVDCVEQRLPEGHESLGVRVEVDHVAPTPVGEPVTATAELLNVSGRKLTFRIEARDNLEVIGKGTHERVVVDSRRFDAKLRDKGP